MRIGDTEVGADGSCYTVAEVGSNHGGSLDTCLKMIRAAADAGADAVKLQRRHNQTLYTRAQYDAPYDNENSFGRTYGEHREALELPLSDWRTALDYAQDCGITLFGTAFDHPSVDDLVHVGAPAIKIASGDLRNTPLIRYAASTGLPLVISTGGGNWGDCLRALDAGADAPGLALLHCTMAYPCPPEHLHLACVMQLSILLNVAGWDGVVVGASLHDSGISSAVVAYMLGARIIEKHFTLDRTMRGTDHAFSLEPQGMRKMVRDLYRARISHGSGTIASHAIESLAMLKMGKGVYTSGPIPAGTLLAAGHLKVCSPATPVSTPPYLMDMLIGRVTAKELPVDHAIRDADLAPFSPQPRSETPAPAAIGK